MKLLILSCNTGEGHHSAALAVQEALNARGVPNDIMDPLSSVGEATRKRVCELYNSIIRNMPKAFGLIYRAGELVDSALPGSPVYFANSLYASRLLDCIREGGYDGVISTHLYGMEAMTAIRRKLGVHVPNYGVLTDYTCIPFFSDVQLDGYFIPHRDLAAELAEKGMDARLLIPTGIPVSERFAHALPQDEARRRLNLPEGKRVYLVMTGGVGCGNVSEICDGLRAGDDSDFLACVLTGRNEELRAELAERYRGEPRVRPVEFTREVSIYMNAADVLITKPGGLSSTEAAAARVPLVHWITIPGCEERNADFFSARGLSVQTRSPGEAASLAVALARDPAACAAMRKRQAEEINPYSARDAVGHVLAELERRG